MRSNPYLFFVFWASDRRFPLVTLTAAIIKTKFIKCSLSLNLPAKIETAESESPTKEKKAKKVKKEKKVSKKQI